LGKCFAAPFDNLCKYLSERYPERFASWVVGVPCKLAEVFKTEPNADPIQADSLTLLQVQDCILHLEFQVNFPSAPPMPLRMLDYWVRLYRKYQIPVAQVVIALKDSPSARRLAAEFCVGEIRHRYRVIRLWEQDPELFLRDPALLPFATLARADSPAELLKSVAKTIETLDNDSERREISAYAQVLAGLRCDNELIRKIFKEDIMRESVIYQDILQEGIEKGMESGLEKGLQRGLERGLEKGLEKGRREEGLSLMLNVIVSRWGELPNDLLAKLDGLPIERLEELSRIVFNLKDKTALADWLQRSSKNS
jgi:predicted transposase/invertase (TIGR01784 family)